MRNDLTTKQKSYDVPTHNSKTGGEFKNLLNHFWNMFDFSKNHNFAEPKIEVIDNDDMVVVSAEMPGVNENDIDLQLSSDGFLTISGERKQETTRKDGEGSFSEIFYGRVRRTIPLPWDLNFEEANADFEDGVLKVSIPKSQVEKQKVKKLSVKKPKKMQN